MFLSKYMTLVFARGVRLICSRPCEPKIACVWYNIHFAEDIHISRGIAIQSQTGFSKMIVRAPTHRRTLHFFDFIQFWEHYIIDCWWTCESHNTSGDCQSNRHVIALTKINLSQKCASTHRSLKAFIRCMKVRPTYHHKELIFHAKWNWKQNVSTGLTTWNCRWFFSQKGWVFAYDISHEQMKFDPSNVTWFVYPFEWIERLVCNIENFFLLVFNLLKIPCPLCLSQVVSMIYTADFLVL